MKQQILSQLAPDHPWGELLHCFDCVDSTNTLAKSMAAKGAPHGTILIADRQTVGRGRLGRSFQSPSGMGIYLSAILRPQCSPNELMHLTCAVAIAMCDAIEEATGFRPGIKWINDLIWNRRKIAGILTELSLEPSTGKVASAVVGIGINCCQWEVDFPAELRSTAASLTMATGRNIDRSTVAAAMIRALHRMDQELLTHKALLMERYRAGCATIGQEVSIHRADTVSHGRALGIDDNGALLVKFPDGYTEAVNSGEASIRGMYGYV